MMILMIPILNNCINFDLIDVFNAKFFLFVQLFSHSRNFFLPEEIFFSSIYIAERRTKLTFYFFYFDCLSVVYTEKKKIKQR